MKEYRIITGTDKDNQTKLNQWRHKYNMWILAMCQSSAHVSGDVKAPCTTILLAREEADTFPIGDDIKIKGD